MRRFLTGLLLVALMGGVRGLAQEEPGAIARLFFLSIKPGMEAQFEEAYKRHLAWHREQKDPWSWEAYMIESGPLYGQYVVRTGSHHWKDFDERGEMEAGDSADAAKHLFPFLASLSSTFTRTHYDLSLHMNEITSPPVVVALTEFRVKPGRDADFLHAVRKVHEALKASDFKPNYIWISDALGGGTYEVVSLKGSWGEMEPQGKTFPALLEEHFGRHEAQQLMESFWSTVASHQSTLLRHRPDLSYYP